MNTTAVTPFDFNAESKTVKLRCEFPWVTHMQSEVRFNLINMTPNKIELIWAIEKPKLTLNYLPSLVRLFPAIISPIDFKKESVSVTGQGF